MAAGTPFVPTPFTTSVVAPQTATAFGKHSYISVSEYRLAPTAVATSGLVAKSTNSQQDSTWALAKVIERASSWADDICFHRPDGSFAATLINDSMWVSPKADSSLALVCNFRPVLEVVGLALGVSPSQLGSMDSTSAQDLWIDGKIINIPGWWSLPTPLNAPTAFVRQVGPWGKLFAVWSYVCGYPLTTLTSNVNKGDTSLTVAPSVPGGTTVRGIYANTPLTINDGDNTETVVAQAAPSGLSITISATQYAHTVPQAPDSIRVSALPRAIEQAVISLTSCLIKTRGARALQLPQASGGAPSKPAMAQSGGLEDFEMACKLLEPYVIAVLH